MTKLNTIKYLALLPILFFALPVSAKVMTVTRYNYNSGLTASGKVPKIGMVATCDRTIPFGTKLDIQGAVYTVEDRTAKWIAKKYGQCVDIYDPRPTKDLLAWGKRKLLVTVKLILLFKIVYEIPPR